MSDEPLPESDRLAGAPHPRETAELFGQQAAERAVLDALQAGRLHHAWLISGPRGVGKATLAWRIARRLLAGKEGIGDTLTVPPDNPIFRATAALSVPRLFLLRRTWDAEAKRLKAVITVDEVRRMKAFFGLSATDGAHRVVIVDAVDDMNVNAANALLKVLEEPPAATTMLLVSHSPGGLLPTIRSRCRTLRCPPLAADDLAAALAAAGHPPGADAAALAELSGGSAGEALRLATEDGLALYAEVVGVLGSLPALDRQAALTLAASVAGRGNEARYDLTLHLLDVALGRLARSGAGAPPPTEAIPGEADLAARLSPDPAAARGWAEAQQRLAARLRHGRAVNLDPSTLLLDTLLKLHETAADLSRSQAPA